MGHTGEDILYLYVFYLQSSQLHYNHEKQSRSPPMSYGVYLGKANVFLRKISTV